jgi:hypothetical protein
MPAPPQDDPLNQARRALAGQAKMHAIKLYRERNGGGWAAAAEAVERIGAGGNPDAAKTPPQRLPAQRPKSPSASPSVRIVERRRISPMLMLLALAAASGTVVGLVYLLTERS